jgi:hypothetical protein
MILYVNGDSHTAAAEAVNAHAFAMDDGQLFYQGRAPHPENLAVSWGRTLADTAKAVFRCEAESASSNDRILRTARAWIDANPQDWYRTLMIIQWSTWEREEWLSNGKFYQVNASGTDHVPQELQEQYRNYIIGLNWKAKTQDAHNMIWAFHNELKEKNIPHVFFNGNNDFSSIKEKKDWGVNYIGPYDPDQTFSATLTKYGHETVAPNSWHFGKQAHSFWARFMLQYCIDNKFL